MVRATVAAMNQHAVVIAGGGPTGLMLAAELALARVDVAVVERRANQDLQGSRAGGLHARTIELLDQRGVADRFLAQGKTTPVAGFAAALLDLSDLLFSLARQANKLADVADVPWTPRGP